MSFKETFRDFLRLKKGGVSLEAMAGSIPPVFKSSHWDREHVSDL